MSESSSVVSDSLQPHGQTSLSMELSRQEYESGLPFPSPGGLSNPGVEPGSPALQPDSLPSGHQGSLMASRGGKLKGGRRVKLGCVFHALPPFRRAMDLQGFSVESLISRQEAAFCAVFSLPLLPFVSPWLV